MVILTKHVKLKHAAGLIITPVASITLTCSLSKQKLRSAYTVGALCRQSRPICIRQE
jgi:hypothetical protein